MNPKGMPAAAGHGRRPLLSIRNLSIALPAGGDRAHAVRDVSTTSAPARSCASSANPAPANP